MESKSKAQTDQILVVWDQSQKIALIEEDKIDEIVYNDVVDHGEENDDDVL